MQHLWGLSLRLTSKVGQSCFSAPGPWASGAQSRARSSGLVHVATPCCGFLGWTLFLLAASRSAKGKLSQGKRCQVLGVRVLRAHTGGPAPRPLLELIRKVRLQRRQEGQGTLLAGSLM